METKLLTLQLFILLVFEYTCSGKNCIVTLLKLYANIMYDITTFQLVRRFYEKNNHVQLLDVFAIVPGLLCQK